MTMIERVAKAIYEASPFKMMEGPYERQSDLYKRNCRLLARAAIEAMRSAPEHLAADLRLDGQHIASYHDMIDAALSEQQP